MSKGSRLAHGIWLVTLHMVTCIRAAAVCVSAWWLPHAWEMLERATGLERPLLVRWTAGFLVCMSARARGEQLWRMPPPLALALLRLVSSKYQRCEVVKWVTNHPGLVMWVVYHSQRY